MGVALALRSLLEAAVPLAAVTGAVVALGLAALCFGYQIRRFGRAAAVVPRPVRGSEPGHARMDRARRQGGSIARHRQALALP
jgi:hypothetical protein